MTKVGVVVPVLLQFRLALEALHSVRTRHGWQPFIVDNWSVNRGVAGGWNEGCRQAMRARCTHILVINDDVVLSPWAVDALVDLLDRLPGIALASGVTVNSEPVPAGDTSGRDSIRQVPRPETEQLADNPNFSCFMVTPGTLERVGWFDEHFFPACFEDNDYLYRVALSGLLARATTAAPYLHYSQATMTAERAAGFGVNQDYYRRKWGGFPYGEQYRNPFGDSGRTWRDI